MFKSLTGELVIITIALICFTFGIFSEDSKSIEKLLYEAKITQGPCGRLPDFNGAESFFKTGKLVNRSTLENKDKLEVRSFKLKNRNIRGERRFTTYEKSVTILYCENGDNSCKSAPFCPKNSPGCISAQPLFMIEKRPEKGHFTEIPHLSISFASISHTLRLSILAYADGGFEGYWFINDLVRIERNSASGATLEFGASHEELTKEPFSDLALLGAMKAIPLPKEKSWLLDEANIHRGFKRQESFICPFQ